MDFRGLVSKRVWKITFFGLKSGQDLKKRAAHLHQEFPGVPPTPPLGLKQVVSQNKLILFHFQVSVKHFNTVNTCSVVDLMILKAKPDC